MRQSAHVGQVSRQVSEDVLSVSFSVSMSVSWNSSLSADVMLKSVCVWGLTLYSYWSVALPAGKGEQDLQ